MVNACAYNEHKCLILWLNKEKTKKKKQLPILVKSGPCCGLHPPSGLQKQTILSLVSESFMVYRGCGKTSEQTHEVHSDTSSSQYSLDYARLPNRAPEKLNFHQQINLKLTQQDAISCHQTISLLTSLNSKHRHQTLATALLTLQLSAIALYQLQQSHHLGSDFQRNACFDKLTIPTTCLWKAHLTHTVNTVWVTLFLVKQIFFF